MIKLENLKQFDPVIYQEIENELKRQQNNIELIASENIVSLSVLEAAGSILTNKYAEGYPGKRYYGGCEVVDVIEQTAIERAKELFKCEYANVQPHSGAQANMAVLYAVLKPGDTILSMSLDNGGHLSHGSKVNMSGNYYNIVHYGVESNGLIDYNNVLELAIKHKPKLIICGASSYTRSIDFKKFREIADQVDAVVMADIAHIAGLVVTGNHQSPINYAHVTTTTTHKTLRGPRGGLILSNNEFATKYNLNKAVFPGIQGGPLEHIIAAKAVAFKEDLEPSFKEYNDQIIKNCKQLEVSLKEYGFKLVANGSDNHMLIIDLSDTEITGKQFQENCDAVCITCNKNAIPNDPKGALITSGVRIGVPAITTRGFKEEEMQEIARLLYLVLTDFENKKDEIKQDVLKLTSRFPIYE